jgi:hypothetical protein
MINGRITAALAIVLVSASGALALAAGGTPGDGSNAAISQYESVPISPPGGPAPSTPKPEGHGVKGIQKAGGKPKHGSHQVGGKPQGIGPDSAGGPGSSGRAGAIDTAFTGPASAAGGLPFTGFDVFVLAGIGLLLLLAGLAQRRFESKRRS